jgi:hypothetical protein
MELLATPTVAKFLWLNTVDPRSARIPAGMGRWLRPPVLGVRGEWYYYKGNVRLQKRWRGVQYKARSGT